MGSDSFGDFLRDSHRLGGWASSLRGFMILFHAAPPRSTPLRRMSTRDWRKNGSFLLAIRFLFLKGAAIGRSGTPGARSVITALQWLGFTAFRAAFGNLGEKTRWLAAFCCMGRNLGRHLLPRIGSAGYSRNAQTRYSPALLLELSPAGGTLGISLPPR